MPRVFTDEMTDIRRLTLLYDETCGFCDRCRAWLEAQPKRLPVHFVAIGSDEARAAYPALAEGEDERDFCAVTDDGRVFRGDAAWIAGLWALKRYRGLARMLAKPAMQPLTRRAYQAVANNRHAISTRWGLEPTPTQAQAVETLKDAPEPLGCASNSAAASAAAQKPQP